MCSKSRLLHQMSACCIITDESRLNPTSALYFLLYHISSPLSDSFKIMKSPQKGKICRKRGMDCWRLFLSFSEKNSSKHPVGFLTVGNKTAPLLTQKGVEFFHSTPVTHDK